MKIFQWLQNTVQSLWNDVHRLFQPTDDDYPKSGVQPFEGESRDETKLYDN
jgi:hypothetical protein